MASDPSKPYAELGAQTSTGVLLVREELVAGGRVTVKSLMLGTSPDAVILEVRRTEPGVLTLDVRSESGTDRVDIIGDRVGVRQLPGSMVSPATAMAYTDAWAPGFVSSSGLQGPPPGSALIYGDCSDGNATDPVSPLTRDMFYDVLTLTAGYSLDAAGYGVYARVVVAPAVGSARIHDDGLTGQAGLNQKGNASLRAATSLRASPTTGVGGAGGAVTSQPMVVGSGGNGGAGTNAGGNGAIPTATSNPEIQSPSVRNGFLTGALSSRYGTGVAWRGGGSGGNGGGSGSAPGGKCGGGGGVCGLWAGVIRNASHLVVGARGGVGSPGTAVNCGGGGGGGGGLVVVVVGAGELPATDVAGEAGGAGGGGTGVAGLAGSAGRVVLLGGP